MNRVVWCRVVRCGLRSGWDGPDQAYASGTRPCQTLACRSKPPRATRHAPSAPVLIQSAVKGKCCGTLHGRWVLGGLPARRQPLCRGKPSWPRPVQASSALQEERLPAQKNHERPVNTPSCRRRSRSNSAQRWRSRYPGNWARESKCVCGIADPQRTRTYSRTERPSVGKSFRNFTMKTVTTDRKHM